jgi:biotin carboxylase
VPSNSAGLKVDFTDRKRSLGLVEAYARVAPFDGVLGLDDSTVEFTAAVAARLGLPSNPPEAVRISQRKDKAREVQRAAGLRSPSFRSLTLESHCQISVPNGIDYPCVAKPVSLSASRGVIRANSPKELMSALSRIQRILDSCGAQHSREVIIEDYIPGEEYAVDGLLEHGHWRTLAIFAKPDALEGPYFEETIYVTSRSLKFAEKSAIEASVISACSAYGLFHGPVHAECRVNSEGVWLIELATRTIGGKCSRILQFGTGHTLEEIVILNAIGHTFHPEMSSNVAGVMMIPVPEAGVLRRVEGAETARRIRHIQGVEIDIRPGQLLVPWPEGSSYPGFIFSRAAKTTEVIDALRSAHRALNFIVAPELPLVISC